MVDDTIAFIEALVGGPAQLCQARPSRGAGCNNVRAMKPQSPTAAPAEKDKLRFGLPGGAKERGERIKAAIRANRETLRRLAK
jgi:hypothetical protein